MYLCTNDLHLLTVVIPYTFSLMNKKQDIFFFWLEFFFLWVSAWHVLVGSGSWNKCSWWNIGCNKSIKIWIEYNVAFSDCVAFEMDNGWFSSFFSSSCFFCRVVVFILRISEMARLIISGIFFTIILFFFLHWDNSYNAWHDGIL